MHLIAAERHGGHICEEITDSLLRRGARVDDKDNLLQWTALQYAGKTENNFVIKRLLENCIDN
jgi:ankyrin repeat protein